MKFDDAFGIHNQALQLKAKRAEVLAGNIANADTPGYKARDFDFREILQQQVTRVQGMKVTQNGHIQSATAPVPEGALGYRVPLQPSLDGNTVDTHLEQTAYATNALEYQASLRFLGSSIKKLMLAIKGQ